MSKEEKVRTSFVKGERREWLVVVSEGKRNRTLGYLKKSGLEKRDGVGPLKKKWEILSLE